MAWIYLLVAGALEVVWAYAMKLSEGFHKPGPSAVTLLAMIGSFGLLAIAMRTIPLSTAYPIWTGIGAVGAFVVGITIIGEPVNATKLVAIVMIVAGLVLLKTAT